MNEPRKFIQVSGPRQEGETTLITQLLETRGCLTSIFVSAEAIASSASTKPGWNNNGKRLI